MDDGNQESNPHRDRGEKRKDPVRRFRFFPSKSRSDKRGTTGAEQKPRRSGCHQDREHQVNRGKGLLTYKGRDKETVHNRVAGQKHHHRDGQKRKSQQFSIRKMTIESVVIQTNTFISEGYGKLRQVSNRKPG